MNLQQLYYFRTIAELEHYTRASEALSVSQSSLSHAIQGMEQELNVQLFAKTGRNVTLTEYGKVLLPYVSECLKTLEAGMAEVKHRIDPDTGTVTIGCLPSLAPFVPDVIVRYISGTNRVGVHVHTKQEATYYALREQLLSGKVDLVFATEFRAPQIAASPIGEHNPVLLVPKGHRLAEREGPVDLRELDGEDYVAFSHDSLLRRQQDALFRRLDIHPHITAETAQDVIIYGLVAAGHGVAVTPWPLGGIPYHVQILPLQGDLPRRRLYLMWNKEAYMPPAAVCFRDFIMEQGLVFDKYRKRNGIG